MDKEILNYRELGNAHFKNKMYREAIQAYTQGIQSINDKEELSLLFSNRAICHYNLSECIYALSDAYRSIQLNSKNVKACINCAKYSNECNYHSLESQCYQAAFLWTKDASYESLWKEAQRKYDASQNKNLMEEKTFKTIHGKQEKMSLNVQDFMFKMIAFKNTLVEDDPEYFKSLSNNLVDIVQIEGYGRGLVAKKNIKKGEIIIYEEAFLTITLRDDICALCLINIKNPIYSEFKEEVYCSKYCKEKAWEKYLKPLSGINLSTIREDIRNNSLTDSGKQPLQVFKIFAMIQLIKPGSNDLSLLPQIKHLSAYSNPRAHVNGGIWTHFANFKQNPKFAENEAFDFQFYFDALNKLVTNSCNISPSKNSSPSTNACGIFLLYSYLNHDCYPNATWNTSLDKLGSFIEVKALKDIKKGEQVFISYIDEVVDPQYRKSRLVQYGIECSCKKCL